MIDPRAQRYAFGALLLTVIVTMVALPAIAQDGPPRLSPRASVSQTVGSSTIDIVYSRPSVRERPIWGELVPYGEVWRSGANEATTFAISSDATIDGKALPAGSYALFSIPGKDSWTVIFNQESDQWGAFGHDAAKDALRIEVKPHAVPMQEALAITFPAFDEDSATVQLAWERAAIAFEVAFDSDATTFAKAKAEIAAAGAGSRAAYNWARYYQGEGSHLEPALEWATAAAGAADHYWTQSTRARLLAQLGRSDEAKKVGEHALTVIDAGPNPEFAKRDAERLREEMASW